MKVLVVCKLGDNTVKENVLLPILASNIVSKIYVLRDRPAEKFDSRVEYLTSKNESKNKSRHIGRFWRGIMACRRYGIDVIVGVLDKPHGYIGRCIGIVTHTPYIHMTIAGHREFWLHGPKAEKVKLWLFGTGLAITVTGNVTKEYLIKKGLDGNKIFVLPNLPDEAITKAVPQYPKDYDIISFSRIDANKNLKLLIEALAILKQESITPKVAIAGDGDKLDEIKRLAKEKDVDKAIDFLGFVRGFTPKVQLLTNSRIFISCSKGEGFPVSLIEAMNCGCVPVVSNVGDIADVIRNGENGFMFDDYNNPTQFAAYLKTLLLNPDLVDKMAHEVIKIHEKVSVAENGKVWNHILKLVQKD